MMLSARSPNNEFPILLFIFSIILLFILKYSATATLGSNHHLFKLHSKSIFVLMEKMEEHRAFPIEFE